MGNDITMYCSLFGFCKYFVYVCKENLFLQKVAFLIFIYIYVASNI